MKTFKYYFLLFLIGAAGYSLLEIFWRGTTHWSMALDGGICLILITEINRRLKSRPIALRALLCALLITAVELVSGIILNLHFKMEIWDYSDRFMNFYGQICPLYSFLWFVLSYFVLSVSNKSKEV